MSKPRNIDWPRGGQTAPLRTFACGSLSFPKNYICFSFLLQSVEILQNDTVAATVCSKVLLAQNYFCKSFQNKLTSQTRRLQINSCFQIFILQLSITWLLDDKRQVWPLLVCSIYSLWQQHLVSNDHVRLAWKTTTSGVENDIWCGKKIIKKIMANSVEKKLTFRSVCF